MILLAGVAAQTPSGRSDYDVIVYGGSSAGVIAAVQSARMGKTTLLISPDNHVGGMTASGLGTTDTGNAATIGGLAATFYANVYQYYHPWSLEMAAPSLPATDAAVGLPFPPNQRLQFNFEPHIAETIFLQMLQRAGAEWLLNEQLDRTTGVLRTGTRIYSLRMKSGTTVTGREFIDATYEGDLMAAAGVTYRVGRESRAAYHESVAGVWNDTELVGEVDPYRIPGNPATGLLPGISAIEPGPEGAGDHRIQQFNLRLCLTNVASNRVPIPFPASYDRSNYELLARRLQSHPELNITDVIKMGALPNGKVDVNANESFSTDMAGDDSSRWPEASDAERAAIVGKYRDYTAGLLWFLAHDPAVPEGIRHEAAQWGLAADEFQDSDHWPWQLYVREARRMVGAYLMTQHNCDGEVVVFDSVALASYPIDSHKVTLFVDANGQLNTEGYMFHGVQPYPISYRSIVPAAGQCDNLFVPVCLSATHAAFNSIRMEPVYMMLGQAAATAACLAIDSGATAQAVKYVDLAKQLKADGQILKWPVETSVTESAATALGSIRTLPTPSLRQRILSP